MLKRYSPFILLWLVLLWGCRSSYQKEQVSNAFIAVVDSHSTYKNSEIEALLTPYRDKMSDEMSSVLIESKQPLSKAKPNSAFGNLLADIVVTESQKLHKQEIDFGSINYGGIRTVWPEGNITVGHVYEVMPFDNELVVLELKGSTVLKLFNLWARNGGIPISGCSFEIDQDKLAKNILIRGSAFNPKRNYQVALTDYVANGGDNCDFLSEAINYYKLDKKYRDAIIDNLKERKELGVLDLDLTENRIQIQDE